MRRICISLLIAFAALAVSACNRDKPPPPQGKGDVITPQPAPPTTPATPSLEDVFGSLAREQAALASAGAAATARV